MNNITVTATRITGIKSRMLHTVAGYSRLPLTERPSSAVSRCRHKWNMKRKCNQNAELNGKQKVKPAYSGTASDRNCIRTKFA